jgi:hypothetical protein
MVLDEQSGRLFDLGENPWHEIAFRTVAAALATLTEQPATEITQPTWSPPLTHLLRLVLLFALCGSYALLEVQRMRPHGLDCSF